MARTAERTRPLDRLKGAAGGLAEALAQRAVDTARDKVEDVTGRLTDYVEGGGGPGLAAALTGAKGLAEGKSPTRALLGAGAAGLKDKASGLFGGKGKGKGGRQKLKLTNIVESLDVGVPLRVAYDQWTQFSQFPTFMKKVENVEQAADEKLNWKAQIFWSHRTWEATILDQRPDDRIVWRSKGEKGHVDGAVTFHELGPSLTRIILVLEYHPQGLFERTGNLWRAQGRRARLELKHFQRHVTTHTLLHSDELEGWRGVIEDGEVVTDHETATEAERGDAEDGEPGENRPGDDRPRGDESGEPGDDREDDDRPEDRDDDRDDDEDRDEDERDEAPRRRTTRTTGTRTTGRRAKPTRATAQGKPRGTARERREK